MQLQMKITYRKSIYKLHIKITYQKLNITNYIREFHIKIIHKNLNFEYQKSHTFNIFENGNVAPPLMWPFVGVYIKTVLV